MYANNKLFNYLKYRRGVHKEMEHAMVNIHLAMNDNYDLITDYDTYKIAKKGKKKKRESNDDNSLQFELELDDNIEPEQEYASQEGKKIFDMYNYLSHLINHGMDNEIAFCNAAIKALDAAYHAENINVVIEQELTQLLDAVKSGTVSNTMQYLPMSAEASPMQDFDMMNASGWNAQSRNKIAGSLPAMFSGGNVNIGNEISGGFGTIQANNLGRVNNYGKYRLTNGELYSVSLDMINRANRYLNVNDMNMLFWQTNCNAIALTNNKTLAANQGVISGLYCEEQLKQILINLGDTSDNSMDVQQKVWDKGIVATIRDVTYLFSSKHLDFCKVVNLFDDIMKTLGSKLQKDLYGIKTTINTLCDLYLNYRFQSTSHDRQQHLNNIARMGKLRSYTDTLIDKFLKIAKSADLAHPYIEDIHLSAYESEVQSLHKFCLLLGDMNATELLDELYSMLDHEFFVRAFTSMLLLFFLLLFLFFSSNYIHT